MKRKSENIRCRARVAKRDDGICGIYGCSQPATIWAHILPRGSHPELSAMDVNSLMLCQRHDMIMDAIFPGALRIDWLEANGRERVQIQVEELRTEIRRRIEIA